MVWNANANESFATSVNSALLRGHGIDQLEPITLKINDTANKGNQTKKKKKRMAQCKFISAST